MTYFTTHGLPNFTITTGLKVFRRRRVLFCRLMVIAFYLLALGLVAVLQVTKAHAQELQTTPGHPDAARLNTSGPQPILAMPTKAPGASRDNKVESGGPDWSGVYFGGHTGFGAGSLGPGDRKSVV